jgi:rare lipoprotein A|tara:strand:- start:5937 stop:6722 length:786 start_codon:yes stop_codon:yes gene_type:complete
MTNFISRRLITLISLFVITSLSLTACTTSRYQHSQDFFPNPILDPTTLKDAVIKKEPLSAMGNPKKYTVFGKEYAVMEQSAGFKEEGYASWYGMKFHGHATSNGEIYDVYQMTAAHKTLPLPSYVKVTRKDTQESLIVRVNDRGPFHEGRIIDLSYAAAVKLGINKTGVAEVSIEVVSSPIKGPENWLQVSALSNQQSALALQQKLQAMQQWPVLIISEEKRNLHKVRIGPIPIGQATEKVRVILQQNQLPDPLVLAEHQL